MVVRFTRCLAPAPLDDESLSLQASSTTKYFSTSPRNTRQPHYCTPFHNLKPRSRRGDDVTR